jgi:hypothetical protein
MGAPVVLLCKRQTNDRAGRGRVRGRRISSTITAPVMKGQRGGDFEVRFRGRRGRSASGFHHYADDNCTTGYGRNLPFPGKLRKVKMPQLRSFVNFEFCRRRRSASDGSGRQECIVSSCIYEASAFLGMRYHKTAATRNNAGISPSRFARSVSSTIA